MVKGCSYFLLLTVLLGNSYFFQFLKFPILIAHYGEHKQLNPEVSALDFLYMHYYGEDIIDQDHDRDMQLPFKKLEDVHVPFIYHALKSYRVSAYQHEISSKYMGYHEPHFSSPHCRSLFKPPRA